MLRCGYVDVMHVSREIGGRQEMLMADGLHPSAAMYKKWVDRIEPVAAAALSPH
jgi:lysophospholipase L1-like esterase